MTLLVYFLVGLFAVVLCGMLFSFATFLFENCPDLVLFLAFLVGFIFVCIVLGEFFTGMLGWSPVQS